MGSICLERALSDSPCDHMLRLSVTVWEILLLSDSYGKPQEALTGKIGGVMGYNIKVYWWNYEVQYKTICKIFI